MRRLSIALTISMLLAPATSFAAYESPSELLTALQAANAAQNFSLEAHVHTNGAYISFWMNGAAEGGDVMKMDMQAKSTLDIVFGGLKVRAKADFMTVDGMLYVKLSNLDGGYNNAFASVSTLLKQKLWIRMPIEEAMLSEMTGGTPLSLGHDFDPTESNNMFLMQSASGKNNTTVYSLSLSPDYAPDFAMMIREIFNENSATIVDFFPWHQLAESIHYDGTVIMNAKGGLVSSSFSLRTNSEEFSLSVSAKASPATSFSVKAPKDSVTTDELMLMFGDVSGMSEDDMMMDEADMMDWMQEEDVPHSMDVRFSNGTFDAIDAEEPQDVSSDCSSSDITALQLLGLQRSGVCPVVKPTTRHGGW